MTLARLRRLAILALLAGAVLLWLLVVTASLVRAATMSAEADDLARANDELGMRATRLEAELDVLNQSRRADALIAQDGAAAARLLETALAESFAGLPGAMLSLQGRTVDGSVQVNLLWRGEESELREALSAFASDQTGAGVERLRLRRITDRPGHVIEVEIVVTQSFMAAP